LAWSCWCSALSELRGRLFAMASFFRAHQYLCPDEDELTIEPLVTKEDRGGKLKFKAGLHEKRQGRSQSGESESSDKTDETTASRSTQGKRRTNPSVKRGESVSSDRTEETSGSSQVPDLMNEEWCPAWPAPPPPKEEIECKRAMFGRMFDVTLVLNENERIGLGVKVLSSGGCRVLRVEVLQHHGAVATWNRTHPDRKIEPGDLLVQVNNKTQPQQMVAECNKTRSLVFRVKKGD